MRAGRLPTATRQAGSRSSGDLGGWRRARVDPSQHGQVVPIDLVVAYIPPVALLGDGPRAAGEEDAGGTVGRDSSRLVERRPYAPGQVREPGHLALSSDSQEQGAQLLAGEATADILTFVQQRCIARLEPFIEVGQLPMMATRRGLDVLEHFRLHPEDTGCGDLRKDASLEPEQSLQLTALGQQRRGPTVSCGDSSLMTRPLRCTTRCGFTACRTRRLCLLAEGSDPPTERRGNVSRLDDGLRGKA